MQLLCLELGRRDGRRERRISAANGLIPSRFLNEVSTLWWYIGRMKRSTENSPAD